MSGGAVITGAIHLSHAPNATYTGSRPTKASRMRCHTHSKFSLTKPRAPCKSRRHHLCLALETTTNNTTTAEGEIVEVKALKGIRVLKGDEDRPRVEYLVAWKDGSPDTWEQASNLADDLLRDYEQRWWTAVRKADEETMCSMLDGGGPVLAKTVDDARRSALHFAAALGRAELVERLLEQGAEVDLADKEGYTPLHMAAGYLHTSTIIALLKGGADPEQKDRQGRSPLELVESLRAALPPNNPSTVARRVALEDVLKVLTENLFEDVYPSAVLDSRMPEQGNEAEREFLIKFSDEEEPVWVAAKYVSEEVVEDFQSGLEYAEAERILDVRNRGDSRTYLIKWKDDYPSSWEPEENVSPDLIRLFEEERKNSLNNLTF